MLTQQEVFNKVARHLILQNKQSTGIYKDIDGGGKFGCMYRGDNGLMCAAGCVIPDELYSPDIENTCFSALCYSDARYQELFNNESVRLVTDLQIIHDGKFCTSDEWPARLEELALEYKLDGRVIEETLKERESTASAIKQIESNQIKDE
jgi:hypothetical protein